MWWWWQLLTAYLGQEVQLLALPQAEQEWLERLAVKANRRQAWHAATLR